MSSGGARWPCRLWDMSGSARPTLDDWRQFGTGLVGLQAVERGPSLLAFRMDDRKQRIVIDRAMPDGARFFGWEVADAAALDALAARLEKAEVEVTAEPQTLADNRRVRGLISFHDPAGNRLEAFYGAEIDDTPFSPGPLDFRLPHRPARPRPCRADGREYRRGDAVLCRRARLRAERLHAQAVPRLFLSRQCAASQPCPDRDRHATACII